MDLVVEETKSPKSNLEVTRILGELTHITSCYCLRIHVADEEIFIWRVREDEDEEKRTFISPAHAYALLLFVFVELAADRIFSLKSTY